MHGLAGFISKFDVRKMQQIFLMTLAISLSSFFICFWPQWLCAVKQRLPYDLSIRWFMSFPSYVVVTRAPKVAALTDQGVFNEDQGKFKEAISDFSKAIDLDPYNAEVAYADRGDIYDKMGYLTRAMSDLNEAVAINPEDPDAYLNRGNVHFHEKDFDLAISDYSRAIRINPHYGLAYVNRAISYYLMQKYRQAWTDIHRAEELNAVVNPDFISMLKKASD